MKPSDRVARQLERLTDRRLAHISDERAERAARAARRILTRYDGEETTNPDGAAIARAFRAADKSRP